MGRKLGKIFFIDEDLCFGCGACIALCPLDILSLHQNMVYVDEKKCSHCELCIPSCPVAALYFIDNGD